MRAIKAVVVIMLGNSNLSAWEMLTQPKRGSLFPKKHSARKVVNHCAQTSTG